MTKLKKQELLLSSRRRSRSSTLAAASTTAADNASSRIAAPLLDRSTAPGVGLLPEAAPLGCLPGPETA